MSFDIRKYLTEIILGIVFLTAYLPAFLIMWDRWFARDSYYSHGILIPFVTGYLIYQQQETLRVLPRYRSFWGILLFLLGTGIYLLSSLFRINFSTGMAMLISLCGIVWYLFGGKIFRQVLFPLSFLIFMVPLPSEVIVNISFRMKIFAATIATGILNYMGIPAFQAGSIISMRHSQVTVDDVCSGLRSLISLTALGSICAYWLKGPIYKKVLLFLITIPVAIITNVCRILVLSTITEIWGPQYATGLVHDIIGFMVFALAFLMLFAAGKLLE